MVSRAANECEVYSSRIEQSSDTEFLLLGGGMVWYSRV